jgi:hypothetical protein
MRHAWLKHDRQHRSLCRHGTQTLLALLTDQTEIVALKISVMPLNVRAADIVRAQIILWEREPGQFGIAWELPDGRSGAERVGNREDAELLMSILKRQRKQEREAIIPLFPKDTAAS